MIKEHVSQVFFRSFGPLCKYFSNIFLDCSMWRFVADDHCDLHLNTIECNFDGGDCLNSPYAHCHNRYWINDNECDLPNNITECDYDGGDCLIDNPSEVTCDLPRLVGNGVCNQQLNHEGCEFDGGDCIDPGCLHASQNDFCYEPANWPSCDYDYGDCIWVNAGNFYYNPIEMTNLALREYMT